MPVTEPSELQGSTWHFGHHIKNTIDKYFKIKRNDHHKTLYKSNRFIIYYYLYISLAQQFLLSLKVG